jgi:sRNA-binding protein
MNTPAIDSPAEQSASILPIDGPRPAQVVLEKLFELYPHLFGADFLPLKLGIFQELLAAHPEVFNRADLKAALGVHTRSTRYLQCVAAGKLRHDLQGAPVEAVAPEHICLALMELFRRRQGRSKEDLRPKLRKQLAATFDASGLSRQDFLARFPANDTQTHVALADALAQYDQQLAKQEALCRAFESSGQSVEAFAEMYGLQARDVSTAMERHRRA